MTVLSFKSVDENLRRWASAHNVSISEEYKDYEVRSFFVSTRCGPVQVWVDPEHEPRFEVVACNNRLGDERRIDRVPVNGIEIGSALDTLVALINRWESW